MVLIFYFFFVNVVSFIFLFSFFEIVCFAVDDVIIAFVFKTFDIKIDTF